MQETIFYVAAGETLGSVRDFAEGTGFSIVQSDNLKWRAEIHLADEPEELTAADFAGKWVKYIGDDGAGVGDMTRAVYDADGDGIVDRAKSADSADSVAWADVRGKPSGFAPEAHTHGMEALSDPVRQRTRTEANPTALCLDIPVLINSATQTGAMLPSTFPESSRLRATRPDSAEGFREDGDAGNA